MSPEQAEGLALGPASDWYCVGVMLYEALCGERPHAQLHGVGLLMAKQAEPPGPPSQRQPDVPADLDRLCLELLAREPTARPDGAEILRRLGRTTVGLGGVDTGDTAVGAADVFVGRAHELEVMARALRRVRQTSTAAVVFVEGHSGTGKSALVQRFVAQHADARTVVLTGRCYERESVPYKGLDELVDGLREHLLERGGVAPFAGAGALSRLFPVLADVPGIGDAPVPRVEDPLELRRQGIDGLRELLFRVATARTLVLVLDDLQWCDDDTAQVLLALMRPRFRPPALVVACQRPVDGPAEGAPSRLRDGLGALAGALLVESLPLAALAPAEAVEVATALLPARSDRDVLARAIAAECEGSPLFVAELVRHSVAAGRSGGDGVRPQLDAVIRARAARLPAAAQALLACVAVAARPLPQRVAIAAAAAHEHGLEAVALLRSHAFVRTTGQPTEASIEPYHDRVAVSVRAGLPIERVRAIHRALATELERIGGDAEEIAFHFEGAGESEHAIGHVTVAAAQAKATLAFRRAARLYRLALALLPAADPRRHALQRALADTLASDGRGPQAAEAYAAAAASAKSGDVLELRRAAAEQLLRSGRLDEGIAVLRGVLEAIGLSLPRGPRATMAALLAARLQVRLRGLDSREQTERTIDPGLLLRIDTTWAAATGLLQASVLLGQTFQARHLLLALDGGEPRRVARALGVELLYVGTSGTRAAAQYEALRDRVEGLCRRVGDPQALGVAGMAAGVSDVYRGRFAAGRDRLIAAEQILRERCTAVQWELGMVRTFLITALFYTGELAELRQVLDRSVRDAIERDDLHTQLMLRIAGQSMAQLADDRADEGLAEQQALLQRHPTAGATATYAFVLALSRSRLLRYLGDGDAAVAAIDERIRTIERSFMLSKQPLRIFLQHDRGAALLTAAQQHHGTTRARLLARARADATALLQEDTRWSRAMSLPLFAALHAADGEPARAAQTLLECERAFVEQGMPLHAASALRRRGELQGGPLGAEIVATADAALQEHGAVRPVAFARHLAPPVLGW